ncbi:aromatic amino acid transaminase [Pseudoroseicyclus tamaricis]|uniref:Aminotransferase n=1 Tax=Pseudoroseicyclus tamaricis TaxID=2705421 RepID=A0A6B2JWT3_9RHOB|nr:amino acid aminotransferase [Pseudoroseicyclus tamaricis]NDV02590.1 aspartate/tyrosine/aromatic aminotransferase [Pseudoroseicyclus tamaricis]
MLETLSEPAPDKILALMAAYRADERAEKIDLGVGVYKNAEGATPVMRAVKEAEARLQESQQTKSYTGLAGDPAYADAMIGLILGEGAPRGRLAAVATPGGTGAVRQAFELIRMASPNATIWYSEPTWPNHVSILKYLQIPAKPYRYFDSETGEVDVPGMLAALEGVAPGDVVLLHGCCHNPTGANLTGEDWDKVVALLNDKGALPMVDLAYQGFGDGLEADATGVRRIVAGCPEALIAASCSKNFGIYRERAGLLVALAKTESEAKLAQGNLAFLNRQNYSFPPDHGARVVTEILTDAELRADWQEELEEMREGMLALRQQLADELRRLTNSDRFDFVARHRGMFSRLGLTPEEVEQLRAEHAVYMVGDSRINIAGLNARTVPVLAQAIAQVI